MALSTSTVWEVRPGVGSPTAGGGFVTGASGTDFSQQNAANSGGNNSSTTDAVANGTTTITSATASFTAAMVGNIIYLAGGSGSLAAVRRQVVTFTNATTIVLDATVASGTGITMNIGGAVDLIATAHGAATANNVIYIKATGNNTVTTALTVTLDSTAAPGSPLSFIGYTTTRTDNGQATWTTSTNSVNIVEFTQAKNVQFKNLILSSTAGTRGKGLYAKTTGNSSVVSAINCKLSGFSVGVEGNFAVDWAFTTFFLINSRITGCTSHGLRNTGSTYIMGSVLDANGGAGAIYSGGTLFSGSWTCAYSIFYANGASGIDLVNFVGPATSLGQMAILNCDCSTNTGAGLLLSNNITNLSILNSIFDANTTYGVDGASGTTILNALLYSNAFYNNTTAATRNMAAGFNTVTLSASPYTSIGTDFSLNSTAGGGAACKAAGFPGVLQFGGTGFQDIGAIQSQGSTTNNYYPQGPNIFIFDTEGE